MELLAPEKRRAVRMIREELCCKLCGRVFDDPHCLDCKHNFCRECIFMHIRKSESSCPKCKLPTMPSEITKNQFLQSILSAWKAVEQSLAPLEDPDSAALQEKQEKDELEEKARAKRELPAAANRGPVASSKWNINTAEIKQEAEAAARRANAIEMFGGSLVERAARKNAALEAQKSGVKRNGFGADHFRSSNGHAEAQVTQPPASQTQDASQTQLPSQRSQLLSPSTAVSAMTMRRPSPFSSSQAASPSAFSLSSLSSPLMGTQEMQAYRKNAEDENRELDEWEKRRRMKQLPITRFQAASPGGELRPTISAMRRVQEMTALTSRSVNGRSPGKRKRQIFQATTDSSDEEEDEGQSQTQMPATMADSPDHLGFGGVAPPVAAASVLRPAPVSRVHAFKAAVQRKQELRQEEKDAEGEMGGRDEDQDRTWIERRPASRITGALSKRTTVTTESAVSAQARKRLVVPASQAVEVVDMTLDDDDDDDDDDAVEDSQMPGHLVTSTAALTPAKNKRSSKDFEGAIRAFQQSASTPPTGSLHRLSGGNDPVFDSPPAIRASDMFAAANTGSAAKPTVRVTPVPRTGFGSATKTPQSAPLVTAKPPLVTAASSSSTIVATGARGGRARSQVSNYTFVGSDLTAEDCKSVVLACQRLGGRFGVNFDMQRSAATGKLTTSTTHLITKSIPVQSESRDLGLRCKRTAKYMRALAEGVFVVDYSWVEASVAAGKWLPEDKYEMSGDIYSDAIDKPRESRLRRIRTGSRNDIFRSFQFVLLCPEKDFDFRFDTLRATVVHFGATVEAAKNIMRRLPEAKDGKTNLGVVSKILEPVDAKRLWDMHQVPIVRVTWIFDSISHLEVLPFDEYYPY